MKNIFALGMIAISILVTANAEARFGKDGYLLDLNVYNTSNGNTSTTTSNTSESKSSSMLYDINAGKLSEKGYYFGAIYTGRSLTSNGAAGLGGSAMGLSVGLFSESGYFVTAHYLLTAKNENYESGSGYQLNGGFKFSAGNNWLIGANLSYRSITYTKVKPDNPSFTSLQMTEMFPMLSFGYMF